jgi:hypothetical protein
VILNVAHDGSPGETALVVPPGDWGAVAYAVERLLHYDARRPRGAGAGSRLVRRWFDCGNVAAVQETHIEAYTAVPERYQRVPADVVAPEDAA